MILIRGIETNWCPTCLQEIIEIMKLLGDHRLVLLGALFCLVSNDSSVVRDQDHLYHLYHANTTLIIINTSIINLKMVIIPRSCRSQLTKQ